MLPEEAEVVRMAVTRMYNRQAPFPKRYDKEGLLSKEAIYGRLADYCLYALAHSVPDWELGAFDNFYLREREEYWRRRPYVYGHMFNPA